ncbi:MAG: 6,7-dimethyl-8-ribityllumazine synthase [Acidobacteria bacterium]|nr:6,7-dimethyl-8-ribityllumazine synthase [Acidobacteriota bacterium]
MNELEGRLDGKGLKFAIVVSRFNDLITERLLQGALSVLRRAGVEEQNILVVRVPGAFEIPLAAQRFAEAGNCDAVICLGALIRGETPHFDYIATEVTRGIGEVALKYNLPVSYGVITADTVEQAMDRSGLKQGNKGSEAALTAVEMATLVRRVSTEKK